MNPLKTKLQMLRSCYKRPSIYKLPLNKQIKFNYQTTMVKGYSKNEQNNERHEEEEQPTIRKYKDRKEYREEHKNFYKWSIGIMVLLGLASIDLTIGNYYPDQYTSITLKLLGKKAANRELTSEEVVVTADEEVILYYFNLCFSSPNRQFSSPIYTTSTPDQLFPTLGMKVNMIDRETGLKTVIHVKHYPQINQFDTILSAMKEHLPEGYQCKQTPCKIPIQRSGNEHEDYAEGSHWAVFDKSGAKKNDALAIWTKDHCFYWVQVPEGADTSFMNSVALLDNFSAKRFSRSIQRMIVSGVDKEYDVLDNSYSKEYIRPNMRAYLVVDAFFNGLLPLNPEDIAPFSLSFQEQQDLALPDYMNKKLSIILTLIQKNVEKVPELNSFFKSSQDLKTFEKDIDQTGLPSRVKEDLIAWVHQQKEHL
mmetsp:Transcript_258/g.477  ORF Transcript_258/g.477 Transcript_258/m.477 type:complete len:422 (+) Transcript_258:42-1307(+)